MTAVVSATVVGAYLAGGLARASVANAKIERLAGAASDGFSQSALDATARDASALAIARRFDPSITSAGTDKNIRLAAFADGLEARRDASVAPRLVRASLTTPAAAAAPTPARPFHLRGALQESRDLECLTQAVYYEARGESADGQAAVAQVVLNRSRHPAFPKTVCGVVYQGAASSGCQFSFACDGSAQRRVESHAWRRAEQVAARALEGFVMNEVGNSTHFHVARVSPSWGPRLLKVAQVGAHVFYRFSGRGGAAKAFSDKPVPSEPLAAPVQVQPVYASLALAPLANSVANSVADAAAAGAEMVMAATSPKAAAAAKPADTARPLLAPAAPPLTPALAPVPATDTASRPAAPAAS